MGSQAVFSRCFEIKGQLSGLALRHLEIFVDLGVKLILWQQWLQAWLVSGSGTI